MSAPAAPISPALVQVRRMVPARPGEVYRAWTEPELVQRWFKPRGSVEPPHRLVFTFGWERTLLVRLADRATEP